MDHINQKLDDVMNEYIPKVPPHRYSVNFVPVVNTTTSDIRKTVLFDPRYCLCVPMTTDLLFCRMAREYKFLAYCVMFGKRSKTKFILS